MDAEALAREVRLLVLDVDGVLTDGGLYYDASGHAFKRFHVQDGLGVRLAQEAGLRVAIVSGLDSPCVERRARDLGIEDCYGGRWDKVACLEEVALLREIPLRQMAYLGDDWIDAPAMRRVGLPMAVANARPEIRELAAWVSSVPGGQGAVREAVCFLLQCQGRLEALWRRFGG